MTYCSYDPKQLMGMILNWEPNYLKFSTNDFNHALGVYTDKYFTGYGRYRRMSFRGTSEETSISLLKTRPIDNTNCFVNNAGYRFNVNYSFDKKLWNDGNAARMIQIDMALIQAKLIELRQIHGFIPNTLYRWPLSFSLRVETVQAVLNNYGLNDSFVANNQIKSGDRIQ